MVIRDEVGVEPSVCAKPKPHRYKERTTIERVFCALERRVRRPRGARAQGQLKVMTQVLWFGIIALTADQLLRLA